MLERVRCPAACVSVLAVLACGETGLEPDALVGVGEVAADCVPARGKPCAPATVRPPADSRPPRGRPRGGAIPEPVPPRPNIQCEAAPPARCWYAAADAGEDGDGTFDLPFRVPQDAVLQAAPGDFIYLRGGAEFTKENAFVKPIHGSFIAWIMPGDDVVSGEPGAPITLKSYPGEQAVIRGELVLGGHLGLKVGRSHWRIEGLRIYHGVIQIGDTGVPPDVEGVRIAGNHLSDVIAPWGNFGLIQITGQHTQGGPVDHALDPADIQVIDNVAHTLWGEQEDGSVVPWDQDLDVEHHACFAGFKWAENVEVRGNIFSECAAGIYFKWESPGPLFLEDNTFGPLRVFGRSRALDVRCEGNTLGDLLLPETFPIEEVCVEAPAV